MEATEGKLMIIISPLNAQFSFGDFSLSEIWSFGVKFSQKTQELFVVLLRGSWFELSVRPKKNEHFPFFLIVERKKTHKNIFQGSSTIFHFATRESRPQRDKYVSKKISLQR